MTLRKQVETQRMKWHRTKETIIDCPLWRGTKDTKINIPYDVNPMRRQQAATKYAKIV